ncbi:hypothetical protein [Streptomyces zaomyceticus]|uniref:hypothetical protein n=1 Tax=Streptomyces zaomyceticus TaxID=68286 RepID=UPI0037B3FBC1
MTETFGPEYVRPTQRECPDCPCCSVDLCEKGRTSLQECRGHTREDVRGIVADCPCSAEVTRGTAAWRAARYRVTLQATVQPIPVDVESALRAVAAGEATQQMAEQLQHLTARRYVVFVESRPVLTHLGARYLEARDEHRFRTPVQVESVDVVARTARVVVVGWHLEAGVTVLLDQLVVETKLQPSELPGKFLEADANCRAKEADDLVLTQITVAPPLPAGWTGQAAAGPVEGAPAPGPVVQTLAPVADQAPEYVRGEETGRVDGAPSGGQTT